MHRSTDTLLAAVVALLLTHASTLAQQCDADTAIARLPAEDSLALRYAPTFRFAPGEPYFPTNPLGAAFDGKPLAGGSLVDLTSAELVPLDTVRSADGHDRVVASREILLSRRDSVERHLIPHHPAVFYAIKHLSPRQAQDVWHFLESDEQRWERVGKEAARAIPDTTSFLSIEYYLYFPQDIGLGGGHAWDVEVFAAIMPQNPTLRSDLRLYIGAGHTESVANNVLLLTNPETVHALVEYGDHSVAPDVYPYGVFELGEDVNWHVPEAWGVRDVQSKTGLGAVGPWAPWMASTRTDDSDDRPSIRFAPHHPDSLNSSSAGSRRLYQLLSASALDCMFRIATGEVDTVTAVAADAVGMLLDALRSRYLLRRGSTLPLKPSWAGGDGDLAEEEMHGLVRALRVWEEGLYLNPDSTPRSPRRGGRALRRERLLEPVREPVENILPWYNKHYLRAPTRHLKAHLFRPVLGAQRHPAHVVALFEPAVTVYPQRGTMVQLGLVVPAFFLGPKIQGYLQVQAGTYSHATPFTGRHGIAISIMHTSSYSRPISWYVRATWIDGFGKMERGGLAGSGAEATVSDWLVGGGAALIPPFSPWLRLRVGLGVDARGFGLQTNRLYWEFMASPFRLGF